MAKQRGSGKKPKDSMPLDPRGMDQALNDYLSWLKVHNFAETTVFGRHVNIRYFLDWCSDRGVTRPEDVSLAVLEGYQRHLYYYRHPKSGNALSFGSQRTRLSPVRAFFKWLSQRHRILYNPAADMALPKGECRLPRNVLTASEAEQVINQTDIHTLIGVRDRAILEVLYSTGIRRMELCNLQIYDFDWERRTLLVRLGKGKKDRVVPLGERAQCWCDTYQKEVRPELAVLPDEGFFFLTQAGDRMIENRLTQLVHDYLTSAALGKTGSCHVFRHTMATVMLENGADIRYIQQMLGHATLETTEVYTHVSIKDLQDIHRQTHPSATLSRHISEGKKIKPRVTEEGDQSSSLSTFHPSLDAESETDSE